jgi:hypothetical protein
LLEQLPRLLDRNFLLGFFIPVTLYQAVGRVLMSPSWKVQYLIGRWENDPTTGLIFVIIISVILVYLLVAFNQLLLIFLEGYYPPINSMPWLKDRQLRRWRRIKSQIDQVDKAWNTLECGPRERFVEAQYERTSNIALLAREFPGQSDYILPTRFGNVIRAFEFYPKAMYGIDSISVWPRLIKIISDKSDPAYHRASASLRRR